MQLYVHENNRAVNYIDNVYVWIGLTSKHLLAPVQTIFPELNIRAVVRGSLILMITAANRYSNRQHICTSKIKYITIVSSNASYPAGMVST